MDNKNLINRIAYIVSEIDDRNKHQWNNDKPIVQAETLIGLLDSSLEKTILTYRVNALAETAYANEREQSRYNGWANYQTWCVNLWLSNEYSDYQYLTETIGDLDDLSEIKDLLESYVDNKKPTDGLFSDLAGSALQSVDWQEIAQSWFDDTNDVRQERNKPDDDDSDSDDDDFDADRHYESIVKNNWSDNDQNITFVKAYLDLDDGESRKKLANKNPLS